MALDEQTLQAELLTIGTIMIKKIALTTDFSAESTKTFDTSLALAGHCRVRLDTLRVIHIDDKLNWVEFPRVSDTLATWDLLPQETRHEDAAAGLGVEVVKVDIRSKYYTPTIVSFILRHPPDLLVAASHGRAGINWWLAGSAAIETLRKTSSPAPSSASPRSPSLQGHGQPLSAAFYS